LVSIGRKREFFLFSFVVSAFNMSGATAASSSSSSTRRYRYTTEIQQMMFVFGEVADALPETTALVEDIVRAQVIEIVGGQTDQPCCRLIWGRLFKQRLSRKDAADVVSRRKTLCLPFDMTGRRPSSSNQTD
jgi:hypothetical protein